MQYPLSKLRWFNSELLVKYPHLTKKEAILWGKYLSIHVKDFENIAYDVTVSDNASPFAFPGRSVIRNWAYLKSLKIDVLARSKYSYYIYEIKPLLDIKAIGQVQIYETLLKSLYYVDMNIRKVILTSFSNSVLESAAEALGIKILLISGE